MTVRVAEKALLLAVRDRLRRSLGDGGAGLTPEQCDVEADEMAPATVGDLYVAVCPGGWTYGPNHHSSGGVRDVVYGANLAVIKRIKDVPRDRTRDVFLNNLDSLDAEVDKIVESIDWKYEVTVAANDTISKEAGSSEGFIHPLYLAGQVGPPRWCEAEMFAAAGSVKAGLMRIIPFHGARRITTIV